MFSIFEYSLRLIILLIRFLGKNPFLTQFTVVNCSSINSFKTCVSFFALLKDSLLMTRSNLSSPQIDFLHLNHSVYVDQFVLWCDSSLNFSNSYILLQVRGQKNHIHREGLASENFHLLLTCNPGIFRKLVVHFCVLVF